MWQRSFGIIENKKKIKTKQIKKNQCVLLPPRLSFATHFADQQASFNA